jgi:hypothetical protein
VYYCATTEVSHPEVLTNTYDLIIIKELVAKYSEFGALVIFLVSYRPS